MSVWAKSWAYEQRCGEARKSGKYEGKYKGNPSAKSVLVAIAEFANEKGECWASQDTLAEMCDMEPRTVRTQLAHLEKLGFIERTERRRKDGTRSSDVLVLQAPADRLKPPTRQRPAQPETDQPENFSAGDHQPENGGASTGKLLQHNRKTATDQPENFSGLYTYEPSVEPSGEPVARGGASSKEPVEPLPDDATGTCLLLLKKVKGVSKNYGELAVLVAEFRGEFPGADPVEVCRDYEFKHRHGMKTKNHALRLREFFRTANGGGFGRASPGPASGNQANGDGGNGKEARNGANQRGSAGYTEDFEFLFSDD